jgi:hypothetical protein
MQKAETLAVYCDFAFTAYNYMCERKFDLFLDKVEQIWESKTVLIISTTIK